MPSKFRATRTATLWPWKEQTWLRRKLTKSLVPYVSEDDLNLDRVAFLRTVVSRIEDDLRRAPHVG